MPMLDAYIPEGALSPSAERELLAKITDLLLEHEGVDPSNERARPLAWVFVHRPQVYVAGAPPKSPRYRFICQVPEGQYDDARRAAVTAAMTQAVAEAERGAWPHPELRVCVFTCEVPEGWWGGREGSSSSRTSTSSPGRPSRARMGSLARRPSRCSMRAGDRRPKSFSTSLATDLDEGSGLSDSTVSLLDRWATWHWFRTGLGVRGFLAALRALQRS
jgi:phenylpyruvate tautomerase PptA (4-oxalocrotonate tautomerase family)